MQNSDKKILYLGPEGSYTELATRAAIQLLNLTDYKPERKRCIKNIIDEIDNNRDYIAVVPVENSIEGVVRETVDNIIRTTNPVTVFQEIVLPIKHCLITKADSFSKIKTVTSHPQGLAQCQNFIYNTLRDKGNRHIELVQATSTSEAVRSLVDSDESCAAISSKYAAELYNIPVLQEEINDEKDNKTRFICIGYQKTEKTGNDRTSIAFEVENKAGSLVDVLMIFKKQEINLSYIDSRPSKKSLGAYTFFVDFDGHVDDDAVIEAISQLKPMVSFYRLIGSYPKYRET